MTETVRVALECLLIWLTTCIQKTHCHPPQTNTLYKPAQIRTGCVGCCDFFDF